jgi:hypothetical protein
MASSQLTNTSVNHPETELVVNVGLGQVLVVEAGWQTPYYTQSEFWQVGLQNWKGGWSDWSFD